MRNGLGERHTWSIKRLDGKISRQVLHGHPLGIIAWLFYICSTQSNLLAPGKMRMLCPYRL